MALRLFIAALIGLIIFIGCGGGGGGGGSSLSPVGPSIINGRISGNIQVDTTVASTRNASDSILASRLFLDSMVVIEDLPNYSARADEQGNFYIENVPFGTHRLVARIKSLGGRDYKTRTALLSLNQENPEINTSIAFNQNDLAEAKIRLQIKDLDGIPVGRCNVWFWGERFTIDSSNFYVSPAMPKNALGKLKIIPPSDKELSAATYDLPGDTFKDDYLSILGFTLPTSGIQNQAPVVNVSISKDPNDSSAFIRLIGESHDPEGEPIKISWQTNVSTFTYKTDNYADWAIPSEAASATIAYSASEDGFRFPRLTSTVYIDVDIASSGVVTFPDEIVIQPVTRTVDIYGTATTQIPGDSIAMFEARTDFPEGFTLSYDWSVDGGTILSGTDEAVMIWRSPVLGLGEAFSVIVAVEVADGVGTARKEVEVRVTSTPVATIDQPVESSFEPGLIEFAGRARDYLNSAIPPESLRWFIATDTASFALQKAGVATFSYRFTALGSYTIALECTDNDGNIGTGTKEISIVNSKPVCVISSPANDSSFRANTEVAFVGVVNDYEDGLITSADQIFWSSDIDGFLGSGTSIVVPSLSSSRHSITLSAYDSDGAVGSSSIVIWYDLPARITYLPADSSVLFAGNDLNFIASGTDSDNTPLDAEQFKWYLDSLPDVWQTGASFTLPAGNLSAGIHQFRIEGVARLDSVVSPVHSVEVGWPNPVIVSPASGTRFEPGAPISFAATPDSTGTLSLEWFINDETTSFGTGANTTYTPANGLHTVTYVGTDSQGISSKAQIGIVVEREPILSFQPADGSYIFGGRRIDFSSTCVDTNNDVIPDDRVGWYLDSFPWQQGKEFSVVQGANSGQIATGTHDVTLVAVGPYGTIASRTHTLNTGIAVAQILIPADNSTFNTGTNINFMGIPDNTGFITMQWWLNYGTAGQTLLGEGQTFSSSTLPDGYHEITYRGVDSTGYVSADSIHVSIGKFPEMDFTPNAGEAFFANQTVTFTGVGTDTLTNLPIPANKMSWYVEGVKTLASYSSYSIEPSDLSTIGTGLKQVELQGINSMNAVGNVIKGVYLGIDTATITSPLNDTVIPTATPYSFNGLPDSIGPITMEWWLDYQQAGATLLGNGQTLNATLPDGVHYLTYLGTDSAGLVSSASIRVIVSDSPSISFTPSDGSRLFVNQTFNLTIGGAVVPETVKWFKDGEATEFKTGSPATINVGDLTVGTHLIKAEGENLLGVTNDITNTIYYGVELASITAPASGSVYAIGSTVNLGGVPTPVAPIDMHWYRDDGSGPVYMGNTANLSTSTIPPGRHTITYVGTDSANFSSSAEIQIVLDDPPVMDFTPGNATRFFAGSDVTFVGTGTGSISAWEIDPLTMSWYLDGAPDPIRSNSPVTLNAGELLTGNRTLKLTGVDQFGVEGSVSYSFYYGHPLPEITSPASGAQYAIGANINFTATPDSVAPITMSWYLDYGLAGEALLGTGANLTHSFATRGVKNITYLGTDSAGLLVKDDIQVLINDGPVMTITSPVSGGKYFGGQFLSVSGSGLNVLGDPLNSDDFTWYLNGVSWKTAIANFSATTADLGTGTQNIKLEGKDDLGTSGSVTNTIETGFELPEISGPASGSKYAIGATVNFSATPDTSAPINFYWYLDYGQAGETYMDTGAATTYTFASRGLKTITYLATDSANTLRTSTIQIVVNDPPTMNLVTPIEGGYYFGGQSLTFSGNGTDSGGSPLSISTFKWFRDGSVIKTGFGTFAAPVADLPTGTIQISLQGSDEFSMVGGATRTIQVGIELPTVTSPASGTTHSEGSTVNLVGSPDLTGMLDTEWYWQEGAAIIGSGPTTSIATLSRGLQTLIYRGTDTAGSTRFGSIQVVVNDSPVVNIATPLNGGKYFGGQSLTFSGNGTDSGGSPLDSGTFKWYRDGTLFKSGFDSFTATVADLPTGTRQIALQANDEFGTVSGATFTVELGISLPVVTDPASGSTYATGANVNLVGVPDLTGVLNTEWYWQEGAAIIGSGPTASIATLSRGLQTLIYRGTDSAGTTRSGKIQIVLNDNPTVSITTPVDGGKYFGGQSLSFAGTGTDAGGSPLDVANFSWSRDGSVFKTGVNSFFATIAELPTGTRIIALRGEDEFGAFSTDSNSIEVGISLPSISSPASGTRFNISQNVDFSGSPDSTGPITMQWYENYPPGNLLGAGANISTSFATRGVKTITYVGTDSAASERSKTIQILVNDPPAITITKPVNAGNYFGGQNIDFEGSAMNSALVPIAAADLTWYRGASIWKTGVDTFAATVAELPTGTYNISLGATDEYGTFNSATYSIRVGLALPDITSPASGTRFDTGATVAFSGTPDLTGLIDTEWFWEEGPAIFGNGPDASIATLTRGWQTITYRGTDDQGTLRSDSIQVLIDKLPTFVARPFVNSPARFANGPEYGGVGNYIPIHLASAGTQIEFSVVAENEVGTTIPPAQINWFEGVTNIGNVATLTRNFENPGSYTYNVVVEDEYAQVSNATVTFWIWDTETYSTFNAPLGVANLNAPTSILGFNNTTAFVLDAGNDRIVKLVRKTTGLTEAGDLDSAIATETAVASCPTQFFDIAFSGTKIYSLGGNSGVDYHIQSWESSTLHSSTMDYPKLHGTANDQFSNPSGLSLDTTAIYVADTGNNKVKKLDISNGSFYSETQAVSNPLGIKFISASNLFVAENGSNRVLKFASDLNSVASWNSETANNATNFAYSAGTGNLYVTDPTAGTPMIHVFSSTGELLYSFGKNGNAANQGEFSEPWGVAIIQNDLYITDKTNNFIVRFRAGSW